MFYEPSRLSRFLVVLVTMALGGKTVVVFVLCNLLKLLGGTILLMIIRTLGCFRLASDRCNRGISARRFVVSDEVFMTLMLPLIVRCVILLGARNSGLTLIMKFRLVNDEVTIPRLWLRLLRFTPVTRTWG